MSFIRNIDPVEFARRFSSGDRVPVERERIKLKGSLSQVRHLLDKIPPREVDLIYMYFILNKGQKQMARILNITQGAVSLRIKKAIKRLQFLVALPKIDVVEMRKDLVSFFNNGTNRFWCSSCRKEFEGNLTECPKCSNTELIKNIEVHIMLRMFETSCQSVVAREIKLSQCGVRHRFLRNLKKIEEKAQEDSLFKKYYRGLKMISENLNILREVEVPRWKRQKNIVLTDVVL
jgi:DNA-directed RNA polymerase subunit RPC12/RpoP